MHVLSNTVAVADTYIVMSRDQVIAMDIAETIRHHCRNAHVIIADSRDAVLAHLSTYRGVSVVFLDSGPSAVRHAGIDLVATDSGARLVLFGDDAEDEWENGVVGGNSCNLLVRPFSAEMIAEFLSDCDR